MTITPSNEQGAAIKKITDWYKDPNQQVFYLAGYAGTGKSSIAEIAINEIKEKNPRVKNTPTAAYTGKAASVLRNKGVLNAQTIHSLIYSPIINEYTKELEGWKISEDSPANDADLIMLDECFSRNTMVDTPTGFCYIQDIKPGDTIINANGIDTVVATMKKEAKDAAQIKFNGQTITCSKNHRFLTGRGFVCASEIRLSDTIIRQSEAVRLLQSGMYAEKMERSFLQSELHGAMVATIPRMERKNIYQRTRSKVRISTENIFKFRIGRSNQTNRKNTPVESDIESRGARENQCHTQANRTQTINTRRQWHIYVDTTREALEHFRVWVESRTCNFFRQTHQGLSYALQSGFGEYINEHSDRGGRRLTPNAISTVSRSKENREAAGFRVDGIEILELSDSRLDQYRDADGKLYLYDIQAARHSSFSVNGALVHNCSMVNEEMANDLKSFGKKILVMGDPGQLPPISGQGAFTAGQPDVFLQEVNRQAQESPIIMLATLARQGKPLPIGFNESGVRTVKHGRESVDLINSPDTDQVICGLNKTRFNVTQRMRNHLGFTSKDVQAGERIICCKNNKAAGIFNGLMGEFVSSKRSPYHGLKDFTVRLDGDLYKDLVTDPYLFDRHFTDGNTPKVENDFNIYPNEFDWGYAITCHKAQGSQWGHVTIIDDSGAFRDTKNQWLYTALTRSETGLTLLMRS